MNALLPQSYRRALAIAILVTLLGSAYALVVAPIVADYRMTHDSIDRMTVLLGRYRRIDRDLPALKAQLDSLKQQQGSGSGFFNSSSDTLVAAQIQGKLRAAVESAQAILKSTQVLPTQSEGARSRVTLRGEMVADLAAAQRVIYDLESTSPYLFVENVSLRARPGERRAGGTNVDPLLDVRLDVSGYLQGGK